MRRLYPEIEPYYQGFLTVSETHRLYYELSGRPGGRPAVFLHGGPGSRTSPAHRRFFDPERYNIVLFDQRGCGKSTPSACTVDNTTSALVADIERLRTHLGVERWLVFGGSWGSALGLAYAQAHPMRVDSLVLRGIFLVSRRELQWFYQDGASRLFPDEFEKFLAPVPPAERDDLISAYHRLLNDEDERVQLEAARAWCRWEAAASYLIPREDQVRKFDDDLLALAFAKIESHYFMSYGFFESEHELIDGLPKIRSIKTRIVQGRYDIVCPMETAWALHRAWPEADFRIVPEAGHSALEDATISELVAATDAFADPPASASRV